jgi:hypothetical protein
MKRFTMGVGLIQATQINIKMKDKNTIYKIKSITWINPIELGFFT